MIIFRLSAPEWKIQHFLQAFPHQIKNLSPADFPVVPLHHLLYNMDIHLSLFKALPGGKI